MQKKKKKNLKQTKHNLVLWGVRGGVRCLGRRKGLLGKVRFHLCSHPLCLVCYQSCILLEKSLLTIIQGNRKQSGYQGEAEKFCSNRYSILTHSQQKLFLPTPLGTRAQATEQLPELPMQLWKNTQSIQLLTIN